MVRGLVIVLCFQWLGEVLARLLDLPVPGPVLGFAGLLAVLTVYGEPSEDLKTVSAGLLEHLSLLFVPAGVGVVVHLQSLRDNALPLAAAVLIATPVSMVLTALLVRLLQRPASETSS